MEDTLTHCHTVCQRVLRCVSSAYNTDDEAARYTRPVAYFDPVEPRYPLAERVLAEIFRAYPNELDDSPDAARECAVLGEVVLALLEPPPRGGLARRWPRRRRRWRRRLTG